MEILKYLYAFLHRSLMMVPRFVVEIYDLVRTALKVRDEAKRTNSLANVKINDDKTRKALSKST